MRKDYVSFLAAMGLALGFFILYKANHAGHYALASPYGYTGAIGASHQERMNTLKEIRKNPDYLLKIKGQQVLALFFEPELVREELPTVIWQYRTEECVLDVYFSTAKNDPMFSPVVHYELRARDSEISDAELRATCINALLYERNSPRMVDVSAFYKAGASR